MKTITFNDIFISTYPGDWLLLPWIRTVEYGWRFTWLFFGYARLKVPEDLLVAVTEND